MCDTISFILQVTDEVAHLKQCGARLGLTTEKILEVRRLEERHKEDRRKLGVLDLIPAPVSRPRKRWKRDLGNYSLLVVCRDISH